MHWNNGLRKTEEKGYEYDCIDFIMHGSFCIRRALQVLVPIRISLSVYDEF